jgi:hypothetical protein
MNFFNEEKFLALENEIKGLKAKEVKLHQEVEVIARQIIEHFIRHKLKAKLEFRNISK